MSKAINWKILTDVSPKPGVYPGLWSGYVVKFTDKADRKYQLNMPDGYRGINIRCTVYITDTGAEVELDD